MLCSIYFFSDSILLPLKSYLLFLILTSSLMHVGAVPWKQENLKFSTYDDIKCVTFMAILKTILAIALTGKQTLTPKNMDYLAT